VAQMPFLGDTPFHPASSEPNAKRRSTPNWIINARSLSARNPQHSQSVSPSTEQPRKRANTHPTRVALPKITVKR
ncbi:MAG: hypothetical protein AAFP03_14315, partial [Cyanobacteria bacterium J06598_3]